MVFVSTTEGWIVEVLISTVGTRTATQMLFAVGTCEKRDAERLVRAALGNLHCSVNARLRLAPRALTNLRIAVGSVKKLDDVLNLQST